MPCTSFEKIELIRKADENKPKRFNLDGKKIISPVPRASLKSEQTAEKVSPRGGCWTWGEHKKMRQDQHPPSPGPKSASVLALGCAAPRGEAELAGSGPKAQSGS